MSNLPSSLLKLTPKERIYVQSRLDGLTQVASAAAAGFADPKKHASKIDKRQHVQEAMVNAMQVVAEEVGFSRKEAHDMLMQAYMGAATAAEQIQAVKEMINLHGLAVPKKIEVDHKHTGKVSLERMDTGDLMKLAEMENLTLEGEYEVIPPTKRIADGRDDQ